MSGLTLHPATLLFAIAMFGLLMAGICHSAAKAMPDYRAPLTDLSKAMVCAGVGFLLYYLRGHAPWFLTFLVANVFVGASPAFGHIAYARLLRVTPSRNAVWSIFSVGLAGVALNYWFDAPRSVAVFSVSGAVAVLMAMTGVNLVRRVRKQWTAASAICALVTLLMSLGFAVRAMVSVLGDAAAVSPDAPTTTQLSTLLMGAVFVVASSVCFLTMVHDEQRMTILEAGRRDSLTGVYTRAALFEEASRAERQGPQRSQHAVVMVDIDHFKNINDTYGHLGGDVTLAHAGRLLGSAVRLSDVVGRYGGEEFCILLRDCSEEQAAALAQRVVADAGRQSVRLPDGRTVTYTVSAGYAAWAPGAGIEAETFQEVVERADQALYRAKHEGRNRALPGVALATARARPAV